MIRECLFSINNFSNPRVETGQNAVGILIIRLLMMVPGQNPLRPAMGVGIGSVYRFITSDQISEVQAKIENQIQTYLPPEFANTRVTLSISEEKYLIINMLINGITYVYDTTDTESPVQLSDIIE